MFFDSGVGGLSVFAEVKKACPELSYDYLFDNACFPYGDKSEDFVIARVEQLLGAAADRFRPHLIVVACNTASTVALPYLRENITVPVVGVVPAIKPAARLSRRGIIGLLATPGTVKRQYTANLIHDFAGGTRVLCIGSADLARIAEDKLAGISPNMGEIQKILQPWLDLPAIERPDTVVLGCTHYPLLKAEIAAVLGPEVTLVDSGMAIARRVISLLGEENIHGDGTAGTCLAWCTSAAHGQRRTAYLSRFGIYSLNLFELPAAARTA